jgi:hypothetical protein
VKLSNGVEAVVVDFNSQEPTRPKVQGLIAPDGSRYADPSLEEIDLAMYFDLAIESVNGIKVAPFMGSQPKEFAVCG